MYGTGCAQEGLEWRSICELYAELPFSATVPACVLVLHPSATTPVPLARVRRPVSLVGAAAGLTLLVSALVPDALEHDAMHCSNNASLGPRP